MLFHILIEVSVAILLAGFAFGAPSLNDLDLDGKDVSEDADVYVDQRQNGTENYSINLDGVSIIWTPLSSLITASGLLDSPFGTEQNTESEVNGFLLNKATNDNQNLEKNVNNNEKNKNNNKKASTVEILPIEIIEDGTSEAGSDEKDGDVILVDQSKVSKSGNKKRKFSISDFLKPFARRTFIRSKLDNQ